MRIIQRFQLAVAAVGLALASGCGGGGGGSSPAPTVGKWTILVYMNAANDLDEYSALNIAQMQQAATNPQVRIVVQWKQATSVTSTATFNGTRRYLVKLSQGSTVVSQLIQDMGTGIDMGIPQTLNNFIAWGKANYPAEHTALVVWDHGDGWLPDVKTSAVTASPFAVSYDDSTGHAIQIWQFNQAFQNQHLDIVAFDASLMQMDEVAYQLMPYASYAVGSEESPPGPGYPYQLVLAEFASNPTGTPLQLSKAFVDGMVNYTPYDNEKIEQSVVDTSKLPAVAAATANLSQVLVANEPALASVVPNLRTTTQSYLQTTNRYFFDSINLCDNLSAATSLAPVQSACASYVTAASNAVVWEGHNSLSPGSHGLSIDFSPSSFFTTLSSDYDELSWETATNWGAWLSIAP